MMFTRYKCLLVDPGVLSLLVFDNLLGLEPQGNLLLSRLNRVGTVAHIAAHVLRSFLLANSFGEQLGEE